MGRAHRGILVLVLIAAVLPLGWGAVPQRNKAVHVAVSAPWGSTPLALEASEFFWPDAESGESSHLFWKYAETLPAGTIGKSDKEQYDAALAAAAPLVSAGQLDLLQYALAVRQFSPKLQAHRELWKMAQSLGCKIDGDVAVAIVNDKVCVTDPDAGLNKALKEARAKSTDESGMDDADVFDLDHEYKSTNSTLPAVTPVVVHLYAPMGSESFLAFHSELVKRAEKKKVRYILRHTWPAGDQNDKEPQMQVQGYGVEMAIKNMEYKAVDDQKTEGGASAADGDDEEQEVAGFDFKVLLARKPEKEVELLSLRDALLSEARQAEGTDVKVWALKDLGVQASQRILQSEEPLRLIRDLSHNLPALVNSISRMRVNSTIRAELENNRNYMHPVYTLYFLRHRNPHMYICLALTHLSSLYMLSILTDMWLTCGVPQGMNMIFINGRQLALDALTPYSLFDFVKHEMKMMDSMQVQILKSELYNNFTRLTRALTLENFWQALGLDTRSSRKILNAPSSDAGGMGEMGGEETFKLDVYDDEHVFWLNNIEKDDMYKQWPSSLQALLQRGWPGQLRNVRRNLWTAIYMLDAASLEDLQFISEAVNQVNHQLPVRFGFIFKSSAVPPEDGVEASSDTAKTKEGETKEAEAAEGEVKKAAPEDEGIAFYRLFRSLYTRHGNKAAFDFADGYFRKAISVGPEGRRAVLKEVTQVTAKRYRTDKGKTKYSRDLKSSASNEALRKSTAFARNSGVAEDGAACVVNGAVLQGMALDEQNFHYLLQTQMVQLQRMTYFGQIQENEDIYKQYLNHGGPAHKRFHKLIVPGRESSTQMLHITKAAPSYTGFVQHMARLPAAMCGKDTGNARVLTHVVGADMGTRVGCEVVEQALTRLIASADDEMCKHVRIVLVDSSGKHGDASEAVSVLQEMMWDSKMTSKLLRTQAQSICKALHGSSGALAGVGWWADMNDTADFKKLLDKATTRVGAKSAAKTDMKGGKKDKERDAGAMTLEEQWKFSVELFGMQPGATAVATSGRVFRYKIVFSTASFL